MSVFSTLLALFQHENISVLENEPLSRHTSFRIGGPAKLFCTADTVEQLQYIKELCAEHKVQTYVLGKGSNILFSDAGYNGVIVQLGESFKKIEVDENFVHVGAGVLLSDVCKKARENSLSGLEFAFGIPGCVGGAVYMNAGAYGGEMKDVIDCVTFLNERNQQITLENSALNLGYRTSIFEQNTQWCILSANLKLHTADKNEINEKMQDFAKRRADKQPLDMPSAGSTFKRPEGAFAGALIEQCGLRGYQVGGAQISCKHCGFVVNAGNATCEDVLQLTDEVCRIVHEKTGFKLEKEIRVVK